MTHADRYVEANAAYAQALATRDPLPVIPAEHVAIVACMDSRLDIFGALGLERGAAHVIRNAGGVVTDDVIRSLAISQRLLQTVEVVLVHHTDCGLSKLDEDGLREALRGTDGSELEGDLHTFVDPRVSVRASAKALQDSPFIPHVSDIRGFVYDVDTGLLDEVDLFEV